MSAIDAFFAYASTYNEVADAISGAQELLRLKRKELTLHIWKENDISGRPLTDPIFEKLTTATY